MKYLCKLVPCLLLVAISTLGFLVVTQNVAPPKPAPAPQPPLPPGKGGSAPRYIPSDLPPQEPAKNPHS